MMREILFRGKSELFGWIEGWYVPAVEWGGHKFPVAITHRCPEGWLDDTPVIPETVGQYTGLTDKNGKKIFEGDIVRYEEDFVSGVYEVAWAKGNCEFVLCNDQVGFGIAYAHPYLEVIGNIHDNPELIGGGKGG